MEKVFLHGLLAPTKASSSSKSSSPSSASSSSSAAASQKRDYWSPLAEWLSTTPGNTLKPVIIIVDQSTNSSMYHLCIIYALVVVAL